MTGRLNRPGFVTRTQNARRIFAAGASTSTNAERRLGATDSSPAIRDALADFVG